MKILSKEQIYQADKITSQRQNINTNELMERAGTQIFNWLHVRLKGAQVPIHIFCGIGNNGGDGLVVARHLLTHGYNVQTYIVNYSDKRSKDFLINYDRIKNVTKTWPKLLDAQSTFPEISKDDIILDAVFGVGLNREVCNWVCALFKHFKASNAFTVSVDIPSGLYIDKVPEKHEVVVMADYTLSFQTPKLVFFLPQTAKYTTHWELIDIGLDADYLYTVEVEANLIGKFEILPMYKPRNKFDHKGIYGHAFLIGGSYGKIGAITLATKAALHAGAGLVTAFVPKCGYIPLQTALPEAMVMTDSNETCITHIPEEISGNAIGIGPGMGKDKNTLTAFEEFLSKNNHPLVIDADALNLLSENNKLFKYIPENSVVTPHAKELERLLGKWKDDFDKLEKAKTFSKKHKIIIVIKGANTITVYADKLYINSTGNPGMATAGAGDVLCGVICGLMAQGYDPLISCVFGTYLHGKSGDLAVQTTGYQSLTASHIIDFLGDAYLDLFATPESNVETETEESN